MWRYKNLSDWAISSQAPKYLYGEGSTTSHCDVLLLRGKRGAGKILKIWSNPYRNIRYIWYGSLSTPYFRMFNIHIAEAITSCGRHIIKTADKMVNECLNYPDSDLLSLLEKIGCVKKAVKNRNDYVITIDTDSLFIDLGKWIGTYLENKNDWEEYKDKTGYIIELSKKIEENINHRSFHEIQNEHFNSTEEEFTINFKQEIVSPSSLFVEKKRYGCWVVNDEGAQVDKLKITGLDIIRSDSSKEIKNRLRSIMEMILKGEEDKEIREKIHQYKKEIKALPVEDIAARLGVNNINKYISKNGPIKGTPWHVKGVWVYSRILKMFGQEDRYENVHEGEKAKVVYLKPNPYGYEAITFSDRWDPEWSRVLEVDYEKMIEKFFVKKISMLLHPCGKESLLNNQQSLVDLFF